MSEQDVRRPVDPGNQPPDSIERLLRLAGSRPAGDDARTRRVRLAVEDGWHDSLRQRAQYRRRTFGGLAFAAAAVVAIAVSLARRPGAPARTPTPPVSAARLTSATGIVERIADARPAVRVGDEVTVGSAFETGAGGLATFALAGGGEVRLNEHTLMRFADARRVRIERGAVYVDSGSRNGSLVVDTPVGLVRDVGTRFEIGAIEGSWRVRVRDGVVRYDHGASSHQAAAGRELVVEPTGRVVERPSSGFGADWDWVVRAAPAFQVEGRTLAAFLDWVARESGRRVEFSSSELRRVSADTVLHGSIDRLTVEESLDVVLPTCGLSHRIDSGRVIVSRADPPGAGSSR